MLTLTVLALAPACLHTYLHGASAACLAGRQAAAPLWAVQGQWPQPSHIRWAGCTAVALVASSPLYISFARLWRLPALCLLPLALRVWLQRCLCFSPMRTCLHSHQVSWCVRVSRELCVYAAAVCSQSALAQTVSVRPHIVVLYIPSALERERFPLLPAAGATCRWQGRYCRG
jgi:hypothetical protein